MKPFVIDFEKLDGGLINGNFIEIQGAMSVREESQPLEGVHQSTMHISLDQAGALTSLLARLMAQALEKGWKPPSS